MNKKRLFFLAIMYIFFIVLLIFATDIIFLFPIKNVNGLSLVSNFNALAISNDLNHRIDTFIENQDILSTVEFTGWAFIPSKNDENAKEIKLIFASEDYRYEVETELQERFDLKTVLQENGVSDYKHGFITRFSPLQMKNGIYKLFIFCYENEEASGIVNTGKVYVKTYQGFSEVEGDPFLETDDADIPDPIK